MPFSIDRGETNRSKWTIFDVPIIGGQGDAIIQFVGDNDKTEAFKVLKSVFGSWSPVLKSMLVFQLQRKPTQRNYFKRRSGADDERRWWRKEGGRKRGKKRTKGLAINNALHEQASKELLNSNSIKYIFSGQPPDSLITCTWFMCCVNIWRNFHDPLEPLPARRRLSNGWLPNPLKKIVVSSQFHTPLYSVRRESKHCAKYPTFWWGYDQFTTSMKANYQKSSKLCTVRYVCTYRLRNQKKEEAMGSTQNLGRNTTMGKVVRKNRVSKPYPWWQIGVLWYESKMGRIFCTLPTFGVVDAWKQGRWSTPVSKSFSATTTRSHHRFPFLQIIFIFSQPWEFHWRLDFYNQSKLLSPHVIANISNSHILQSRTEKWHDDTHVIKRSPVRDSD